MTMEVEIKSIPLSEEEVTDEEYVWTVRKFEEELFQWLANFKILLDNDGLLVETHPYYDQADDLMYQIPVFKPTPVFEINRAHLSRAIRKKINDFATTSHEYIFDEAIVNAVGKLFENQEPQYYHRSVKRLLTVRFV